MSNELDIDKMRQMLSTKAVKDATPIATLNKGKDGTIDVTADVIAALTPPITQAATDSLKPVIITTIAAGIEAEAKSLDKTITDSLTATAKKIDKDRAQFQTFVSEESAKLIELANSVRRIEVVKRDGSVVAMTGTNHEKFDLLLAVVTAALPVFMVGPAGTGKTAGAERVATAMGLPFYAMSVGSQTSKADIFGYKDAQGNYHATPFRLAYEHGGVFLLDEADAGNANVLVGLNAALSNGYVFFPDGGESKPGEQGGHMVKMHEDFRMIATANTFGNGASRQYVGRNQLDAATLDRFTVITWDIDARIEETISTISPTYGDRWLRVVRAVRHEAIDQLELRAVVSPRATLRGATLLEAGVAYEDVVLVALIANMPEAEREVLLNVANAEWQKSAGATRKPRAAKPAVIDLDELVSVFDGPETEVAE